MTYAEKIIMQAELDLDIATVWKEIEIEQARDTPDVDRLDDLNALLADMYNRTN